MTTIYITNQTSTSVYWGPEKKPELGSVGERQTSLLYTASVLLVSVMKMQKLLSLLLGGCMSAFVLACQMRGCCRMACPLSDCQL